MKRRDMSSSNVTLALLLLLPLAGCVAPEAPPVVRRPVAQTAPEPARTDLEPAPTADRKLKAPEAQAIINVNGLTKDKKPNNLPPL